MSHRFHWFEHIQSEHRSQVGETAMYLGQLVQQRLPVARGFVVPVADFQAYVRRAMAHPVHAQYPPWPLHHDVAQMAVTLQTSVANGECLTDWEAEFVMAVRSLGSEFLLLQVSIAADDADVAALWTSRVCAVEDVMAACRALWAETFCARNLCYWRQQVESPAAIPLATMVQALDGPMAASGKLWVDAQKLLLHGFWGLQLDDRVAVEPNLVVVGDPVTGQLQSQQANSQSVLHSIPSSLPASLTMADPLMIAGNDWLLPYALGDFAQPCLPAAPIQSLLQLGRQIRQYWPQPLQINWQWAQGKIVILIMQPKSPMTALTLRDPEPVAWHEPDTARSELLAAGIMASPGEVTGQAIVVSDSRTILRELPPERILVTTHLTPAWLPLIQQAAGLITEQGGITSHGAILARELGIPAIVGVPQATQKIKSGDWLHLQRGKIYPGVGDPNLLFDEPMELGAVPSTIDLTTLPVTVTQRLAIVSQMAQLTELKDAAIEGIGLVRAEHLLLPHLANQHPWQWLASPTQLSECLTVALQTMLQTMAPRPVWYRTADWRSHELAGLVGAECWPAEANPILGMHGALSYQQFPAWLELELQAIVALPAAERQYLRLILPFVRTVEEFQFCQKCVVDIGLKDLPLWIMAEVPAVIFALSELVEAGVAGIVVGMNDLVQLLFAVDREHPDFSHLFNPNHPAIRQALTYLLRSAQALDLPCHVCSLTEDASFVQFLVDGGVTGIGANVQDLGALSQAIWQAEAVGAATKIRPRFT